jgi:hypothetical protein
MRRIQSLYLLPEIKNRPIYIYIYIYIYISSPATRHEGAWGKRRYSSYSFSTSALDGVSGQRHAPVALYLRGKNPGTHWTGGWVGPRAGLDTEATGKILCLRRESNPDRPVFQPVVRHYTA